MSLSVDVPFIYHIPTEILDRIISSANIWQLAILRQVCSHWRCIVDQPSRWQRVSLLDRTSPFWTLDALRHLLNPHLCHIQSLTISGVRDATVRFLLAQCPQLEHLEVMSWNTLSNHALTLPENHMLKLRRFNIIGGLDQFLALDATCLAHFILHCPSLHHISINHCRLCIHPDIFLDQLQRRLKISCLDALTTLFLSTLEKPWSGRQVDEFLALCPRLYHLHLESKNNTIIMTQQLDSKCITINDMN